MSGRLNSTVATFVPAAEQVAGVPESGKVERQQNRHPVKTKTVETIPVQPKPSRALSLWMAVVAGVLSILWWQTTRHVVDTNNFLIETKKTADGAEVFIDGKPVGTAVTNRDAGVTMTSLRCHVSDGRHQVEVRKPGFQTFHTQINVSGEEYLTVDLKPVNQ